MQTSNLIRGGFAWRRRWNNRHWFQNNIQDLQRDCHGLHRRCWRQASASTMHYNDVIMNVMASQITSLTIVYITVYSWRRSKKTLKLRVTGLCVGNSPVTGEFPAQRASNAENVSIWWRHHWIPGLSLWRPHCCCVDGMNTPEWLPIVFLDIGVISNKSALFLTMARRRIGGKHLSKMVIRSRYMYIILEARQVEQTKYQKANGILNKTATHRNITLLSLLCLRSQYITFNTALSK